MNTKCMRFVVIVILTASIVSSCDHTVVNHDVSDSIKMSKKVCMKSPTELMADSVVNLSFQGFTLGKPLSSSLKNAQENNRVWNIKRSGDETKGNTSIMLLSPNKSLTVSFTIYTYRDTIYEIEYKSSSDKAFGNIADLYIEKYGHYYSFDYDSPDATYNPNNNKYYTWSYSNQCIKVSEKDYVMEIRDYMMKDKETLKYFLNCRDHSVYVYYTDFEYKRKANVADSIKREKEEILRARKQHIQDSINELKEEIRRKTAIKQI